MPMNFEPTFAGASEGAIAAFERRYNWKLPDDYRQFLLRYNGGSPSPPSACLLKDINEPVLVDMLFGLGHPEPDLDVQTWMNDFGEELPAGCLIIGNVGGLLFILCVKGQQSGVFCWDRMGEFEKSADSNGGKMYPVAPTFTEFLDTLKPVE